MMKLFVVVLIASILIISGCQYKYPKSDQSTKGPTDNTPDRIQNDINSADTDLNENDIDNIDVIIDENTF